MKEICPLISFIGIAVGLTVYRYDANGLWNLTRQLGVIEVGHGQQEE